MQKIILILFSLNLFSCVLSPIHQTEKITEARNLATEDTKDLSSFNETLLVGDSSGNHALLKVGANLKSIKIKSKIKPLPISVHSYNEKFYLLYSNSKFMVLDPESGLVEKTLDLPVKDPSDFAFASDGQIYVSTKKSSKILKVDLNSLAEVASIDLEKLRLGKGKIELHQMLLIGENLFVQVARFKSRFEHQQATLAVIDTTTNQLRKTIELAAKDPQISKTLQGMNPEFPMIYDSRRKMILLTLKTGEIPLNMGMIIRIDPNTLEIFDFKQAITGTQGIIAFQEPFSKLFIIYHTSTPVTSSHLLVDLVDDAGSLQRVEGALIDNFDGLNALAINSAGTLVAMANTCITGVCVNGAGISLVEVATHKILPKLKSDFIGFQPSLVYFK